MSKITLTLPFYDQSGKLTPIIVEALKRGATSANNLDDPDTFFFTLDSDDAAVKLLAPEPVAPKKPKAD